MDSWLLKLLSRDMKTKTKKQRSISNHKQQTTISEMDRWEIPILNLVSC